MNKEEIINLLSRDPCYIYHLTENEEMIEIHIMHSIGISFATIYWFKDNWSILYLRDLSVTKEFQKSGHGNRLLKLSRYIGKSLGMSNFCIWVDKTSWMYQWYIRKGFKYLEDHADKDYIWMEKSLLRNKVIS